MLLEILTPDNKVFSGEVLAVNVPGSDGSFEILGGHAPIVSNLGIGFVVVKLSPKEEQKFNIDGGIVEVSNNKVIILADSIVSQ